MTDRWNIDRRTALGSLGLVALGAGAGAVSAKAMRPSADETDLDQIHWDHEADIVCVGSGAAASTAAITAFSDGASVLMVEKLPVAGGTTRKAGGVFYVPNNFALREAGMVDDKADCLRYMARFSYPQRYTPDDRLLGLSEQEYSLLEAFYENASPAVDRLRSAGATDFAMFRMFGLNIDAPDYADHLPENKLPSGRCLVPAKGAGHHGGAAFIEQIGAYLEAKKIPVLTGTAATGVIQSGGRVHGISAEADGKKLHIRARRGVIFATGGYAQNEELVNLHQISLYGACAAVGSTGDFISIAAKAGARMGTMGTAWRAQVVLDDALQNRAVGSTIWIVPGDSMILVNKYGRRVVDEKRNYNDRTKAHFSYDPTAEDFPNQLLFMIFDKRTLEGYGGVYPLPLDIKEQPYLIEGNTWDALFANIDARLKSLAARTGGVRLDRNFTETARQTLTKFDGYAKTGVDPEFGRGLHAYDRAYQPFFSPMREGTTYPANPMPNITMHPMSENGPYYALILAAGALDTSGGPMINARAQVLDANGEAIPGLYGAGNCIAAPTREAYYGAGGTLGPALAFGYVAAKSALEDA